MSEGLLRQYCGSFSSGQELSGDCAEPFFDALLAEQDEDLLTELFKAWNTKGTTANEVYALASIMRARCVPVKSNHETFVDIVGTGGSRSKTFNVSTAAAFVVAGAGVAVAKHGNRSATSNSGSSDALSALGIDPAVEPSVAEHCLNTIGICFMFAPKYHSLSPVLASVRRKLGFPTIFNNLGPLCNPAGAPHQVIGVYDRELVEKTAKAISLLGTKRTLVVHGEDGLDEISISGKTYAEEVSDGSIRTLDLSPEDFGIEPSGRNGLSVSSPEESAAIIRQVLEGHRTNAAAEKLVLINAAAPIYLAGAASDLRTAYLRAEASLRSGAAMLKLNELASAIKYND